MKNLFVAKTTLYGSKDGATTENIANASELFDGSLAIFGRHLDEEVLITQTKTTAAGVNVIVGDFVGKQIRFAVGTEKGIDDSLHIDVDGVESIKAVEGDNAYVYAKNTLTLTPKASPSARDEYNLKVVYRDKVTQHMEKYNISVQGSYANANALVTALKAVVDADPNSPVDATLATNDLVLTSNDKAIANFEVSIDGDFASSSEAFVGASNGDLTDPYFLRELEQEIAANKGTSDFVTSYIPKRNNAVENVKYNVYVIKFKNDKFPKGSQSEVFDVDGEVFLAVPYVAQGSISAGDNVLVLDQLLSTIFSGKFTRLTSNPT